MVNSLKQVSASRRPMPARPDPRRRLAPRAPRTAPEVSTLLPNAHRAAKVLTRVTVREMDRDGFAQPSIIGGMITHAQPQRQPLIS